MIAILIGVLMTFCLGGMLLILVMGASGIEDEFKKRAQQAERTRARTAALPRFFVVSQPAESRQGPLDEALVGQLQQYLDAEQSLAAEFVSQPSLESLYRDSDRRLAH